MKIKHLNGARLALWTARALGHKDAFAWNDNSGKAVVYIGPAEQVPFMPTESWADAGPLLVLLLNAGCVIMQPSATSPASVVGPFGRQEGMNAQDALCRSVVASVYGEEVPDAG